MKHRLLLIVSLTSLSFAYAQTDSIGKALQFSAYAEIFYGYDFGRPSDHQRPSFIYSFNRHNEVNLNLGLIKAAYQTDKLRANLSLATGTYMEANLAAEPGVLKNIGEANAGVKISGKEQLWIDAGIFPSHIGFESAIGKDCWNLTRSLLADNSPYFETGVRVSYTSKNKQWYLSGLLLNGWQRIQRQNGNNTPSFGHQVTYTPNNKLTLNSSSFIGSDKPDSIRQQRIFHNLFALIRINDAWGLTAGLDIGMEQASKGSSRYNHWYAPVLILRYSPGLKHRIAARAEYYQDKQQVIVQTATPRGFDVWGMSVNYDYSIRENALWRVEARFMSAKDPLFEKLGNPVHSNMFITSSLAISF